MKTNFIIIDQNIKETNNAKTKKQSCLLVLRLQF